MAILQATTISGSNDNTGSLQITGSTFIPPAIESSLTSSFTSSGLFWVNADNFNLQYTTKTSKGSIQSPASFMGAWAAGGTMPSHRCRGMQGVGVQNAALAMGGLPSYNATDEYNGTSWASGPVMSCCGFQFQTAGTQDAALAMGMYPARTQVVSYNGSSWSTSTGTPTGVRLGVGGGFQNAAWVYGQHPSTTATLHWNGSSWSSNATIGLSGNQYGGGVGTLGAALSSGPAGVTYAYDGIVWTKRSPNNTSLYDRAASGQQDAAIYASGRNPQSAQSEEWNGLSWVRACDIPVSTDRGAGLGGGNSKADAGLAMGGYLQSVAYEYTKSNIVPYTTSVWSNGAGNIVNKSGGLGAGDSSAALSFGGNISPSTIACTEEYDGTNWSAGGAMIIARINHGGTGTANAALAAGGEPASCCKAEEYNGSTWSTGGNLSQGGYGNATLGTQNAAINFGGNFTGKKAESYDGSSWSTISDMSCCRRASGGGAGTSNAAIVFQGRCYTAPTTCQLTLSEEWDGSSWSFGGSYILPSSNGIAGGHTVSTALSAGGYHPTAAPNGRYQTELYNGVAWSAGANAINLIKYSAGHSVGDSGFAVGGNPGSQNNIAQFYDAVCSTTMCNTLSAWSATSPLITARSGVNNQGFGTQNAAVSAGGSTPGASAVTEEYNGTTWSSGGTMIYARRQAGGFGTQNAGAIAGGTQSIPTATTCTEEYDGSSWSTGGSMITARWNVTSAGAASQTAGLIIGGNPSPSTQACTEKYDGSSWSSAGSAPSTFGNRGGSGVQNNALAMCLPSSAGGTVHYDGTSWMTGNSYNDTAYSGYATAMGDGTYNTIKMSGHQNGSPEAILKNVEEYDGSVWTYGPNRPEGYINAFGAGNSSAGLTSGGSFGSANPSSAVAGRSYEITKTTTGNCLGAWSAGGGVITARRYLGMVGSTQNDALAAGGYSNTRVTNTEEYNGATWSAGGAMITAREYMGGAGTQNAGAVFGGAEPSVSNKTEEYDGSAWSSGGNLITARDGGSTYGGTQNAAIYAGGCDPSGVACTEEYDGSSWSAGGNMIQGRQYLSGVGTQNAHLVYGGYVSPAETKLTEEYNGSSWSTGGNLLIAVRHTAGSGTQNAGMTFAGFPTMGSTQNYNGIGWSSGTNMPSSRFGHGGVGTSTSALAFTGFDGSANTDSTQHFNCSTLLGAGLSTQRTEVTVS